MTDYPHVYFDDRWCTRADATVSIGSLAMRYGLSAFEGIRLYRQIVPGVSPRPFLLAEHLARLASTLALTRMPDPGIARVPDLIDDLVERNGIDDDAYVRVAVTPTNLGDLGTEATTILSVTAAPMGRKRWLARGAGMSLAISGWQRAPREAFPPEAKNVSSYAGSRLAWLEARDAGFDGCVLTNRYGRLCEAPTAALFLVQEDGLATPALSEDVLPSITRGWLLATAIKWGIPVHECPLTKTDAYRAVEAFLAGTAMELTPVRAFDSQVYRRWPHFPVTKALTLHYFTVARGGATGDKDGAPWLTAAVPG